MNAPLITRRNAVKRLALVMGGAFVGAEKFLLGATLSPGESTVIFSREEVALLDEIGDTIIPATSTPGAKAVGIGAFMVMMVNDCYEAPDQVSFKEGLVDLQRRAKAGFGAEFTALSAPQRTSLLNQLDREQREYMRQKPADGPHHYFTLLKQLTLVGYFTSEIGATQALQYVEVPGSYNGNAPYHKGERNWFSPPSAGI